MEHLWEHVKVFVWNAVWAANLAAVSPGRAFALRWLRTAHMLVREVAGGELTLRAGSLVYTTLLSLIPALAVSFAVMKAFNVHEAFQPTLVQMLSPLGDQGVELALRLVGFVEHLDLGKLGSMGVAVLFLTVISLVHKVEQALNRIWRVERPRGFFERFSGYLTVVVLGPVLVLTALGITASVTGSEVFRALASVSLLGWAIAFATKLTPYLLVIAAFTFTYLYIPNTRVRVRSALVGACVAGVLWASLGWLFASLVVTSARYTLLYSSFAILILFMMWLYVGWLILLVGGSVAFYHQNPQYLGLLSHEIRLSARVRERLGLAACCAIARRHLLGEPPITVAALAAGLRVPIDPLRDLLRGLERDGLLVRAAGDPPAWVPARAPSGVTLAALLAAVRRVGEAGHLAHARIAVEAPVERVLQALDAARDRELGERTLADLAAECGPAAPAAPQPGADAVSSLAARRAPRS